jgi:hypothetical protein
MKVGFITLFKLPWIHSRISASELLHFNFKCTSFAYEHSDAAIKTGSHQSVILNLAICSTKAGTPRGPVASLSFDELVAGVVCLRWHMQEHMSCSRVLASAMLYLFHCVLFKYTLRFFASASWLCWSFLYYLDSVYVMPLIA